MKKTRGDRPDSSLMSFQKALLQRAENFSIDAKMREIAEAIRKEAMDELCDKTQNIREKQEVADNIQIVPGVRRGQYLVVGQGNYGKDLEFGTRNSPESPWFIPALDKVKGSIGTCLQGALQDALAKARRLHIRR